MVDDIKKRGAGGAAKVLPTSWIRRESKKNNDILANQQAVVDKMKADMAAKLLKMMLGC